MSTDWRDDPEYAAAVAAYLVGGSLNLLCEQAVEAYKRTKIAEIKQMPMWRKMWLMRPAAGPPSMVDRDAVLAVLEES